MKFDAHSLRGPVRRAPGLAAALVFALLAPSANAVTILDTTWQAEGGAKGKEAAGFGAHLRLAAEPQFRSVLALSTDGESWGEATGTWIGNDASHAYVLTAAHVYELPASPDTYSVRAPDGSLHNPDRIWVHPQWNGDTETRTGFDLAILRLPAPLTNAGPQPFLYSGKGESGQLITFVGYGSRGIGSAGEHHRFHHGSDKAAAHGTVDQWVDMVQPTPRDSDGGNYLGIYLPREDGSIPNPYGGATKPATRLTGLLGSGDSGGSAWVQLGGSWAIVGVNSNGSGTAAYGESSWFTRISGHGAWISSVYSGARFIQ